jgi:hypothetical protein
MRAFILILIINGQIHVSNGFYETVDQCEEAASVWMVEIENRRPGVRKGTSCEIALVMIIHLPVSRIIKR